MVKTFVLGIFLGIAGMVALLHSVPAVDQHRKLSHVTVQPNGGEIESFHINLPRDRILAGLPGVENTTPYGLEWPQDKILAGSQAEVFKLRDKDDAVVGLASRIASNTDVSGTFSEWMLHLPARGSLFIGMQPGSSANGQRSGVLRAGTGEFGNLTGEIYESINTDVQGADERFSSRVQLKTVLIGLQASIE